MNREEIDIRKHTAEKRLLAYASAAGVVLAATAPADATIIFTPANITLSGNSSANVNIDGVGAIEFSLIHSSHTTFVRTGTYTAPGGTTSPVGHIVNYNSGLIKNLANSAQFAGASSKAFNLSSGSAINPALNWLNIPTGVLFQASNSNRTFGNFSYSPLDSFIGIRFKPGGTELYGWIDVDLISSDFSSYHISGWAYEDSGAAINAGARPPITSVPEPSTIALLAAGAAGIFALRRRKKT